MDSYVSDSGPKPLRALTSLLTSKRLLAVYKTAFWQCRKEPEQRRSIGQGYDPSKFVNSQGSTATKRTWINAEAGGVKASVDMWERFCNLKSSLDSRAIESRQ